MGRVIALAAIIFVAALASAPAFARDLYWDACNTSGAATYSIIQGDGKWTGWSSNPDNWVLANYVSTVRNKSGIHSVSKCISNSSFSQMGWAEITFYLTATGYWTVAATQPAMSIGTGPIGVTTTNATGLPTTTDAFSTGNTWNTIGTLNASSTTIKIKFTETATASTKSWYLDQIRLIAATPGAVTPMGINDGAGGQLAWSAGENTSSFDLFLDTNPDPTTAVASDLSADVTSFGLSSLALQPGTTYYWKVVAKNADKSTSGEVQSFTMAQVPEPGGLLAVGAGLIGLIGVIRRRR